MSHAFGQRLTELTTDPSLFLHQLDPIERRALIVDLPLARLRSASFLDQRVFTGARPEGAWLAASDWLARTAAAAGTAPHAIFHIGHCGSTLIARALDALPGTLALREPLPLRTLAELLPDIDSPLSRLSHAEWQQWFARTLAMLARRPPGIERVVVKATSNCNALIEPWLAHGPAARALLLYVPLRPYLATLLKAPDSVRDALSFAPARLAALHAVIGAESPRLAELTPSEAIAAGWLAELARFARLISGTHAARIGLLDFEAFLAAPNEVLGAIAAALGAPSDAASIATALAPERMGRYAKAPEHAYSAAARRADLNESERRHGVEIDAGLALARRLIEQHPALAALAPRLDSVSP